MIHARAACQFPRLMACRIVPTARTWASAWARLTRSENSECSGRASTLEGRPSPAASQSYSVDSPTPWD